MQSRSAVGGIGMICTANYEARKFGVRAAMPGFIAKRLCPALLFVKPNFQKYTAAAEAARSVFARFDPHYSSHGLDEACLNVTELCRSRSLSPDQVRLLSKECAMATSTCTTYQHERTGN